VASDFERNEQKQFKKRKEMSTVIYTEANAVGAIYRRLDCVWRVAVNERIKRYE
jgi:hypothetical protein